MPGPEYTKPVYIMANVKSPLSARDQNARIAPTVTAFDETAPNFHTKFNFLAKKFTTKFQIKIRNVSSSKKAHYCQKSALPGIGTILKRRHVQFSMGKGRF